MTLESTPFRLLAAIVCLVSGANLASAQKQEVTAEGILASYQPHQKDVQYDRPDAAEAAKCTLEEKQQSYTVRDSNGVVLRRFWDSNGDRTVDCFSYYKDGIEVFRETDTNANKVVDEFRWLNTAGIRLGIDRNEDGKIDAWKMISPEEVTFELIASLKDRDRERFGRLLLSQPELKSLGLGKAKSELVGKMLETAVANFNTIVNKKGLIAPDTKWVSFGATQPGLVPAGTEESLADLVVYENVTAVIETGGKPQAINVGTLVRVGDVWRLLDAPQIGDDGGDPDMRTVFFSPQRGEQSGQPLAKANDRVQELIKQLQAISDLDHDRKADQIEKIALEVDTPQERAQWFRQLADTLSAAVQNNGYKQGLDRLRVLADKLKADSKDEETACYVEYRLLYVEHSLAMTPNSDFAKIQTKWIDDLKQFLAAARKYPDSAEAMFELALAEEINQNDEEAAKWYYNTAKEYPQSPVAKKAAGSKTRLECEGKPIQLAGKLFDGKNSFDLKTQGKGKVVLIQYWANWSDACRADLPLLQSLRGRYQKSGFEVVGVCLDNRKDATEFIKENFSKESPSWPQLYEDGGLDSRLANEMGVNTLPLMVLVDKQGRVANRNVRTQELEAEIKKLLK